MEHAPFKSMRRTNLPVKLACGNLVSRLDVKYLLTKFWAFGNAYALKTVNRPVPLIRKLIVTCRCLQGLCHGERKHQTPSSLHSLLQQQMVLNPFDLPFVHACTHARASACRCVVR